jgi:SAM-dependent methyltransferase
MTTGNEPESYPENSFTAHNIRLDDGSETYPSLGVTMDRHPVMLSVSSLLKAIFPDGLEGRSVIDVGCLEGGYATEFARLGMASTGLEVRDSNYANCLYVKSRTSFPNLTFVQGDANDIARYGQFDVFFVNGLLYHLDRPRAFLEAVAANCNKALILHTHVSYGHQTPAAQTYHLSDLAENEGLSGRWYHEHDGMSAADLDKFKWTSWENKRSFWIQKEYLLGLLKQIGFDLVFEQFDGMGDIVTELTSGSYRQMDRSVFVAIKSAPPRLSAAAQ